MDNLKPLVKSSIEENKTKYNKKTINLYFSDMLNHSLLSEEEELKIIKELEDNEIFLIKYLVNNKKFISYLYYLARNKTKRFIKKYCDSSNSKNLKVFILKILNEIKKTGNYLKLKIVFKIPRTDLLKLVSKVVKNDEKEIIEIKRNVEKLHERLINSNLRLVLNIAKKYSRSNVANLFDLVQEGNLGLIRAVDMFFYHKGVRFAAYAKWWIKQAIIKTIYEDNHHIKVPLHFVEDIKKVEEFIKNFFNEHQRNPKIKEIEDATRFSPKKIKKILTILTKPVSIDSPINSKDDFIKLSDIIKDFKNIPETGVFETSLKDTVNSILNKLNDKEKLIIKKRFGLEDGIQRTLDEVGYYFNLTRERIRQIEQRALNKLKVPSRIEFCKKILK
ncbi:MAG TPA: sigma-70 family RNA polymerase sigma factor [Spirochaetota bacterium]|nr:sigma-70 family RNA polymerase sigma factor [Spirochaetota bacterium]HOM38646.1 sigma-70 family RNA polymerase sigma factor [Spirochaetota bacterium]HPQ49838.1 sigma-70 family RNA polymerase sigma factor [Spirochaetota bacterium]